MTRFSEYRDEIEEIEAIDRENLEAEMDAIRAEWEAEVDQLDNYEFILISNNVCPECNGDLDESGYCDDCHIIPALNPAYQQWLANV